MFEERQQIIFFFVFHWKTVQSRAGHNVINGRFALVFIFD
jgi:hypothetical protein